MRSVRILAAAAVALGAAAPASATHGGMHPTFRPETVYFHCSGETKLQQANVIVSNVGDSSWGTWNTSAPSQSIRDGAGCASVEPGWVSNEIYDAVFQGTFRGNLRDITVRIHELFTGYPRQSASQSLKVYAEIDGAPIFPGGTPDTGYTGRTLTVTPTRVNDGASDLYTFSITNIGFARDVFDADGELIDVERGGMALEDGDGTEEHVLQLFIGGDSFLFDDTLIGWHAWAWDTTEVPSGLTFNPPTLAAAKVAANLPSFG